MESNDEIRRQLGAGMVGPQRDIRELEFSVRRVTPPAEPPAERWATILDNDDD